MPNTQTATTKPNRDIFTVSRLVRESKAVLEGSFPLLWLEGELSNLARPASGHIYFSLKDEAAQIRCAMFRIRGAHLGFRPQNGQHVLVRARVSLYEARGEFQVIVEHMEEAGFGALQRQFDALKNKLSNEGLFDLKRKKSLPTLPKRIGIITSPTGAAIRDIISVLKRRFPAMPLLIYPVAVQGKSAADEIAQSIALAAQRQECEVLILARGGGSLEDLWAFNEEVVARAIDACAIPIVTGIGHEIDFSIADFVADVRAATPSAAAELISPDQYDWFQTIDTLQQRLDKTIKKQLSQKQQQLNWLTKRLEQRHPGQYLQTQSHHLKQLQHRLQRSLDNKHQQQQAQLTALSTRLYQRSPSHRLQQLQLNNAQLALRLRRAWQHLLAQNKQRLGSSSRALNNTSPLATLERGYAIIHHSQTGRLIRDSTEVAVNEKINVRLARGGLSCRVEEIK